MSNGTWVRIPHLFPSSHFYEIFPSGIPFNDSVNWRLTIAEEGQQILGNNLLGLQAGNEPDFYEQ